MAPIAVLNSLLSTHPKINSTSNTNVSPSSATPRTRMSSNFGVYRQTFISSSDISIRTLDIDAISTDPYRKALITKLFVRQIMTLSNTLSDTLSISFRDLISTAVLYFGLNTRSIEREAEATTISIYNDFPLVSNLQDVGFSGNSSKHLTVPNPVRRPVDPTYFKFCSIVFAAMIDTYTPASSLTLDF